jgi:FkbM family methyltransferase
MKQIFPKNPWQVRSFKRILKRFALRICAQIHNKIVLNLIKVLQQSIGFGYDSGIENETRQFSKEIAKFNIKIPVILDVGANIGQWSLLINSNIAECEIYAFEPAKETFQILKEKTEGFSNIHALNYGCGEANGSNYLFYDEVKSGMASLSKRNLEHLNLNFEEFEIVEIMRLDEIIKGLSIKPNFLKIDVEGHELAVLKGLGNHINDLKVIQFEFGGTDIDSRIFFQDFWLFFSNKKFSLYRLTPRGMVSVNSYLEHDEIFVFTTYFAIAE